MTQGAMGHGGNATFELDLCAEKLAKFMTVARDDRDVCEVGTGSREPSLFGPGPFPASCRLAG